MAAHKYKGLSLPWISPIYTALRARHGTLVNACLYQPRRARFRSGSSHSSKDTHLHLLPTFLWLKIMASAVAAIYVTYQHLSPWLIARGKVTFSRITWVNGNTVSLQYFFIDICKISQICNGNVPSLSLLSCLVLSEVTVWLMLQCKSLV